jgi:hypothetical protein
MATTLLKRSLIYVASSLLVAMLLRTGSAQVDSPYQAKTVESSTQNVDRDRNSDNPFGFRGRIISGPVHPHRAPALGPEFEKAVEALREAEDDQARSKAEENLRDLLSKYFGEDMKRRDAELKEMAKRLKKLEEQLELRKEKMDEIVDLQMKVLVNQANGLGFFSNEQTSNEHLPQNQFYFYSPRPKIVAQPPTTQIVPGATAVPAEPPTPTPPRPARPAPVAPPTERYVPPAASIEAAPLFDEGDDDPAGQQR